VRKGIYLYLERQTYLSWINAKCPPPSKRVDPKARAYHLGFKKCGKCWDQAKGVWEALGLMPRKVRGFK